MVFNGLDAENEDETGANNNEKGKKGGKVKDESSAGAKRGGIQKNLWLNLKNKTVRAERDMVRASIYSEPVIGPSTKIALKHRPSLKDWKTKSWKTKP